ncbi:MAG: metallophosphoesterase [Pirellulales bacterium]|nr:metallophosphoesterase [Pirellulales bacterium]
MPPRILALGDVHGYTAALDAVVAAADVRAEDVLVALGDFVDRGPDSRGVIQRMIELGGRCRVAPILGNHDEMVLTLSTGSKAIFGEWLRFGGEATLASYDCGSPEEFPAEHLDFLRNCLAYYEIDTHFFVHASYIAELPLAEQPGEVLRWDSLRYRLPGAHSSGKTAIVGHTAQHTGDVLDLGYLKCIDTWIYGDGWLTLMDVRTGQIWQADKQGRPREETGEREPTEL